MGYVSSVELSGSVQIYQTKPHSDIYPTYEMSMLWYANAGSRGSPIGWGPSQ